jgi:hypothetical protein
MTPPSLQMGVKRYCIPSKARASRSGCEIGEKLKTGVKQLLAFEQTPLGNEQMKVTLEEKKGG